MTVGGNLNIQSGGDSYLQKCNLYENASMVVILSKQF